MKKYQKKNIRRLINSIHDRHKNFDIIDFEIEYEMLKVFCKDKGSRVTALYHLDLSYIDGKHVVEFFTPSDLEKLLLISKGEYKK